MNPDTAKNSHPALEVDGEEGLAHLAQVLAHRLRGLVASIEGFTDLLADTLVTGDQRELAWRIMEGASRIESVLADLQLYSAGLEPTMLPVRVNEVLQDLLLPLQIEDRGRIEIKKSPDGDMMFSADPFLLRQALLILLQNAIDATKREGLVHVEVRCEGDVVSFDVWNDGVINVEDAAQAVFVPFFTTKAHNLGVGLSIARRIARLHKGTLELTSNTAEEGTRFSITVPAAA